jgi:preprotein translocase subunit SecA
MRLFNGERMTRVFAALGVEEDRIEHKPLSNAIETAQNVLKAATSASANMCWNMTM